jgi:hypothetical protein
MNMTNGDSTDKLAQDLMSLVKDMLLKDTSGAGQSQLPTQANDTLLESIKGLLTQTARDDGAPAGSGQSGYGSTGSDALNAMRERHMRERETLRQRQLEEREALREEQMQEMEDLRYQRRIEREELMNQREMEREARRQERESRPGRPQQR